MHVGLAVAVDNGLLVPVIRDAAASRSRRPRRRRRLGSPSAARDGAVSPADLEGGTFSVSALGAYGVDAFTPVINPPNAGILGVGRLRDDVVVVDGEVATVKRLTLSLTWDHRVLDGVPAAEFCRTIVELLADPPSRLDLDSGPGQGRDDRGELVEVALGDGDVAQPVPLAPLDAASRRSAATDPNRACGCEANSSGATPNRAAIASSWAAASSPTATK